MKKPSSNLSLKLMPIAWYRDYLKDKTKNLDEQTKQKANAYFFIGLTLFTVSIFGLLAIKPTLQTITNLNKQYQDDQAVYNALKDKLAALNSLDSSYQQIFQDLDYVYSAIPKSNKITYLARQIEKLAEESGVSLERLNFGTIELFPGQKTENYSFTFNMVLEGSEPKINSFIGNLINFDRIISLERLVTGKTEHDSFGATIVGRAYFSRQ